MTNAPSKTVAAWLAIVGGWLGLHRLYLRGPADPGLWLHAVAGALGAFGAWRMRALGVDDRLGNLLVPLLGASLAAAMLAAIVDALGSESRWQARHGAAADGRTGRLAVLGAVVAFAAGAIAAIATIAFVAQRAFEWSAG